MWLKPKSLFDILHTSHRNLRTRNILPLPEIENGFLEPSTDSRKGFFPLILTHTKTNQYRKVKFGGDLPQCSMEKVNVIV
jgi:hypothetical protein